MALLVGDTPNEIAAKLHTAVAGTNLAIGTIDPDPVHTLFGEAVIELGETLDTVAFTNGGGSGHPG